MFRDDDDDFVGGTINTEMALRDIATGAHRRRPTTPIMYTPPAARVKPVGSLISPAGDALLEGPCA